MFEHLCKKLDKKEITIGDIYLEYPTEIRMLGIFLIFICSTVVRYILRGSDPMTTLGFISSVSAILAVISGAFSVIALGILLIALLFNAICTIPVGKCKANENVNEDQKSMK